jgi:hypothetical protein
MMPPEVVNEALARNFAGFSRDDGVLPLVANVQWSIAPMGGKTSLTKRHN